MIVPSDIVNVPFVTGFRSECDEQSVNRVDWYHVTVIQLQPFTWAKKGAA